MADFVARMHPETPILDDSISKALDAYGRILSLLSDFGSNTNNHSQLESALSAAANLRNVMVTSKESIERFRSSTTALPQSLLNSIVPGVTYSAFIDLFLGIYSRGINLLGEIEGTGKSILNSREDKEVSSRVHTIIIALTLAKKYIFLNSLYRNFGLLALFTIFKASVNILFWISIEVIKYSGLLSLAKSRF